MRPTDWAPLADGDPVPGDPDAVAELARRYARMAETIREQAATLRRIGDLNEEVWDSDSGRAYAETARVTVGKLNQVFERYATAAKALSAYHPVLRDAQTESLIARSMAIDAHARLEKAQWNAAVVDGNVAPSLVHSVIPDAGRPAADDLDYARRKLDYAVESVDRAARAAAARIDGVVGNDQLKDSGWQHFKAWVNDQEWIKVIGDVCGKISTIAGLTALVLGCIPGLQPIAVLLETVALVATLGAVLPHLAMAVTGNGSWLDLAIDAVSIATAGTGRAALTGAKTTAQGLRGAARLRRAEQVAAEVAEGTGAGRGTILVRSSRRDAWRRVEAELGPGSRMEAEQAVAVVPNRALPHLKDIRTALDPVAIAKETKEALAALKSPKAIASEVRQSWREASNLPGDLTDDLLAIKELPTSLVDPGMLAQTRGQVGGYFVSTFVGIGVDTANNLQWFEHAKSLTTGAP